MTDPVMIRCAVLEDLPQIVDIYNHYVIHTHITFDIEPVSLADRIEWFEDFPAHERYQLFVAVAADKVLGYAHARALKPKAAYETSVEVSVYLSPGNERRGLGSLLYRNLFASLRNVDVHRAYGVVALPNEASIGLHLQFGFETLHKLSEVGRKFGRYYDVLWLEKKF